jgi:hypothetical protein
MLTLFTTAKPFKGHLDTIQRNAIRSWQQLHPEVEILLFGDDKGASEVCKELGIRHVPEVRKNKYGTKYLASMYDQAEEIAKYNVFCHINCDIILMSDFRAAVEKVSILREAFLMVGRRWDVDIRNTLEFGNSDWELSVRQLVSQKGKQRPAQWMDYFVFTRSIYHKKVPEFVIGRPGWDIWLLWYALSRRIPVVDASKVVLAVHQNHDYGYHPDGEQGVWQGEEAQANYRLLDTQGKFRTLEDASHRLGSAGLARNLRRFYSISRRSTTAYLYKAWFQFLRLTRPARRYLGFRHKTNAKA